ncbi:hypothetical protein ATE84_4998 [Aquimarina sp. MAR_2010_214]|nr:hypothetical protein ATE84_4998 [Aquimarina sp. MAR_2010_214]
MNAQNKLEVIEFIILAIKGGVFVHVIEKALLFNLI